jgi:subtilisin family serine protease
MAKSRPTGPRSNTRKEKSAAARLAQLRKGDRLAPAASGEPTLTQGRARTVLYVHGIGNKPLPEILRCQWNQALFGFDLGERSRLAYWVNRVTYPDPWPATCKTGDTTTVGETQPTADRARSLAVTMANQPLAELVDEVAPEMPPNERAALKRLAQQIEKNVAAERPATRTAGYGTRILPIPAPIRRWITRGITNLFLLDVHEYFFVKDRRDVMLSSVRDRLLSGGGPFVVIAHSQGSMIAYQVLYELASKHPEVEIDLFLTIGSPLGLTEVQDQIKRLTKQKQGLAVPANIKRWVNVSDPLDPVCADKDLDDDIESTPGMGIEDILAWNTDSPRDPHSGSGYLKMSPVREAVLASVQTDIFQRVAPFTLARDLVRTMEATIAEQRHTVLIELREPRGAASGSAEHSTAESSLDEVRQAVVEWIEKHVKAVNHSISDRDLELERLHNYVSARLTRFEVERMASDLQQTSIYRVYRNAEKRALLRDSCRIVQATTAHRGYDADGHGIVWAVLDTGIDVGHPHFQTHATIKDVCDCLEPGPVRLRAKNAPSSDKTGVDRNGHGSHVAGIIAGEYRPSPAGNAAAEEEGVSGIAPACKLVSYKVLSDSGVGSDAKIIKALDHIFERNQRSTSLAIHGVNLSLGGAFDPQAFGCGDSPLCKRLRDLWRQGVVVVLAAGNEGFLELPVGDEEMGLNMDLSIGDPANLDEGIAVGSVHKLKPHHYGVSFFSSRGPTADGRAKPDVVAPGERILSCRAGGRDSLDSLYVELSGTSMAAPHVSGIAACFLSARREFLSFPEKVKERLLSNCTDLKRHRMHQGAGLPNLVKMLLNS